MHNYIIPESVKQRVLRRRDKLIATEVIDAARAALIVVDMQNHFVAKGFPSEVPIAREIVPAINRMAAAMRAAGGTVIWIQTTAKGALQTWANHHQYLMRPQAVATRLGSLAEDAEGYKLYPELEIAADDLCVKKVKYSAMIQGSSDLPSILARRGIDSLLITGTTTNVCCESTARDAAMLDFRVVMLSDGNATWTDEEHAATLNGFQIVFGEVMSTDEAIARLASVAQRKTT